MDDRALEGVTDTLWIPLAARLCGKASCLQHRERGVRTRDHVLARGAGRAGRAFILRVKL